MRKQAFAALWPPEYGFRFAVRLHGEKGKQQKARVAQASDEGQAPWHRRGGGPARRAVGRGTCSKESA